MLLAMFGASALSSMLALGIAGLVVLGIMLFAAPPVIAALLPLLAVIFITTAWAGAGIGGGIAGFCIAIQNLLKERGNVAGWLGLGLGLAGTFATAGAVVGTFIPVPVLGTLVGAASGAVLGVLAGVAAWAFAGIVGAIVIAVQKSKENRYDIISDDVGGEWKSYQPSMENDVEIENDLSSGEEPKSTPIKFFQEEEVQYVEAVKYSSKSSCSMQ
jgi:hypothetical protein